MRYANILLLFIVRFTNVACTACPNDCFNKGKCSIESACICQSGYIGADCSLRTCPSDLAWVGKAYEQDQAHTLAECSNKGLCDRLTGACNCFEGFEGIACQRSTCGNRCSGHGQCLTIGRIYQLYHPYNGVPDNYTNWEANHTTACACDIGYTGVTCETAICPKGYDPLTYTQNRKTIMLQTYAFSSMSVVTGYFRFLFQDQSILIPAATALTKAACEALLQTLRNIGSVICSPIKYGDGTNYNITLLSYPVMAYENNLYRNSGNPPISDFACDTAFLPSTVDSHYCRVVELYSAVNKTLPEYAVCSNRGLCDILISRKCKCFENFTNSNCDTYIYGYTASLTFNDVLTVETTAKNFSSTVLTLSSSTGYNSTSALRVLNVESIGIPRLTISGSGNVSMLYGGLTISGATGRGGQTIALGGLTVSNGISISSGGLVASFESNEDSDGGVTEFVVLRSGVAITAGGIVVSTDGVNVTHKGVTIVEGPLSSDRVSINGGLLVYAGGCTVARGGLSVTGGISVAAAGIYVGSKGLSIHSDGLRILDGGLFIKPAGLSHGKALSGVAGLSVRDRGLQVTSGLSLYGSGLNMAAGALSVTAGGLVLGTLGSLDVNSRGASFLNGISAPLGISVTGGLSVLTGGLRASSLYVNGGCSIQSGGISSVDQLIVESGSLTVTGGLTLSSESSLTFPLSSSVSGGVITGGSLAANTLYVKYGGMSITDHGIVVSNVSIQAGGLNISGDLGVVGGINVIGGDRNIELGSLNVLGALRIGSGNALVQATRVTSDGTKALHGVAVASSGVGVNGGLTILSGGLGVTGGMSVDGLAISSGGMTVQSSGIMLPTGQLRIGNASCNTVVETGGITIHDTGLTTTRLKTDGLFVTEGGLSIHALGLRVSSTDYNKVHTGGMRVSGGITIAQSGIMLTGQLHTDSLQVIGSTTMHTAGLIVNNGLTISDGGVGVYGGVRVWNAGMDVSDGVTINSGGLAILSNGISVQNTGMIVDAGSVTINDGGLAVGAMGMAGGVTVNAGGLVVVDLYGVGLVVKDKGVHVYSGGVSILSEGLRVTGGMSLSAAGLQVTEGGLTITGSGYLPSGGITLPTGSLGVGSSLVIEAGGLSLDGLANIQGGLNMFKGITVQSDGLVIYSPGSLSVVGGVVLRDGVTLSHSGLKVTGGLTVANGISVTKGGVKVTGSGLRVTHGVTISSRGLYVSGGLTVDTDLFLQFSPSVFSDRRLKKNIEPLQNSLSKLKGVKGVYYSWANDADDVKREDGGEAGVDRSRHIGVIAQDVQAVLPELVRGIQGGEYLGVNYPEMIPVVIEAIRELDARTSEIEMHSNGLGNMTSSTANLSKDSSSREQLLEAIKDLDISIGNVERRMG